MTVRLENWSVCGGGNPYYPPEATKKYLKGDVYGHPRCEDGKNVTTSHIVNIDGNKVTTSSGTVYELGKPDCEFIKWCVEYGCHVPTPKEPIKDHKENEDGEVA